ncbi:MAG: cobyric acid synthase [Peptococcaceae bacterium]|jgi:adenosylcobyric acid synthase|nr:cobyric acid synthase [Peptococcaceae bacterium]
MVQGTASHVGKSVLVAALCRILARDGYRVAPYKSQNMALNSYVTAEGGEIGRAQAVQAEAAGIPPTVDMNPILLKPTGQSSSQVIVLGRPVGNYPAHAYHNEHAPRLFSFARDALDRLMAAYEVVVIEGAGSPAEVNLMEHEIVNMRVARAAGAPVLLVADVERGGALASLVGTLALLDAEDAARVAGLVINKFRGDPTLFQPAVGFLEERTGIPVLGVLPYFHDLRVAEEDSLGVWRGGESAQADLDIVVLHLPHLSNFTDFDPLRDEPAVNLRYVRKAGELGRPDLVIIPGSKNTIDDLVVLKDSGLAQAVVRLAGAGLPVAGICGGFQMLGEIVRDPLHTESDREEIDGLGLLPMTTVFEADKVTCQAAGETAGRGPLLSSGLPVSGYEIHMGRTTFTGPVDPVIRVTRRSGRMIDERDGAVSADGLVFGTYLHGLFDNDAFRASLLDSLRRRKGLTGEAGRGPASGDMREDGLDGLAALVRENLDLPAVYNLLGLDGPT